MNIALAAKKNSIAPFPYAKIRPLQPRSRFEATGIYTCDNAGKPDLRVKATNYPTRLRKRFKGIKTNCEAKIQIQKLRNKEE
jgi:hypothetical protein